MHIRNFSNYILWTILLDRKQSNVTRSVAGSISFLRHTELKNLVVFTEAPRHSRATLAETFIPFFLKVVHSKQNNFSSQQYSNIFCMSDCTGQFEADTHLKWQQIFFLQTVDSSFCWIADLALARTVGRAAGGSESLAAKIFSPGLLVSSIEQDHCSISSTGSTKMQ